MYQGYLVTGTYRKTKWWIDVVNVMLGLFIIGIFALSFFIPFVRTWKYVMIFGAGALMNGITGLKKLLERVRGGGAALLGVSVMLGLLTLLCLSSLHGG